ncbi:MAG: pre-peptidase C-terminal domain-containing protein, partial [Planctomycetota bacterium]|nr:pre-peptidase C-terminal domain-containing protein [Planctomycetota bacterium]
MIQRNARRALGAISLGAVLTLSQMAVAGTIDSDQVVITEAETRDGRATAIPWSGIWWAFSDLELATGWNGTGADFEHIDGQGWQRKNPTKNVNDVSPLLKYDAFVEARTGTNPKAALMECEGDESHDFGHSIYGEKKAEYDRDGVSYSWWGHCNGWCAAALMEKEPIAPVVAEGIRFDVADLKGLLSETFWGVESDFTGRRYNKPRALYSDNRQAGKDLLAALENGSPDPVADYIEWYEKVYQQTMSQSAKDNAKAEDFRDELEGFEDWFIDRYDDAFSDMEPHVLHGLLETVIGRKKLAFVMDVTANEEVWNHPAFAYTSDITHKRDFAENGKNFKEWDVETKVWYATDGVSHSILGIKDFYKTYNYTMVTDENDKVIRSAWVGNSIDNHPDFAWLPTNNPAGSAGENPNVRYDEIKRILPKIHRATEDRALDIAANGVTASSQRDEDKTTTWANPIASGRSVALSAAVSTQENISKVRYFEQKVDSYSTYAIVENEPLIALGESSTGPDFTVSADFTSNGRKMVVAFAYDSANRLIAYDEISLQVSNSGSGGNNNSSDDNFEPNNSQSAAATVSAGNYPNLNCNDNDWFKVTLPNAGDLKIDVEFTHSDGDLDITVHSSSAQLGKSDSTANRESVDLTNLAAGTYFVRIYGYNGA